MSIARRACKTIPTMSNTINLFMWGYQTHFRAQLEYRAKSIFQLIGAETELRVLLVGMRRPGLPPGHPVCIEPEDGIWPLALFSNLPAKVEQAIPAHPDQMMVYGDERANREKPERIRQETIADEVKRALDRADQMAGWQSFCSTAHSVDDYDVVCVLQLPDRLFRKFPSVSMAYQRKVYETSLIHACINVFLQESRHGLGQPEPGRRIGDNGLRSPEEIIRRAASNFMCSPFIAGKFCDLDLFEAVNRLSQQRYEGDIGIGRLVLAAANDPNVKYVLRLAQPVRLAEPRWARKLLQMATGPSALVAEYDTISGLGTVSDVSAPPFSIEFLDHHQWNLRRGELVLMRCRFGEVQLPQETMGKERFIDNMQRVFPGIDEPAIARFRIVLDLLAQLRHGSSLVIASDAKDEAERLARQGTNIVPTPLTKELLERATAIDGTILADPAGVCHAIGVILDGPASEESTPSRGARYNSAVRYVAAGAVPRMAFVISEDRTLDVIPLHRPRVLRSRIEAAVAEIASATFNTFHKARSFLDEHRFYLDAEQCRIVNEALDRIENEPAEVGRIIIQTRRFEPHPAFDATYLLADDAVSR
ncbi:diadenylate cyclase [Komagataeibacter xylinus]|uniref:diadenylate cyclase n=1 Tax=Komagataeibacter xylinus TaxID=28448 RepID=UPI00280BF7AF|nr:diadenylate cyclase [Komagataeibacter xylinus]